MSEPQFQMPGLISREIPVSTMDSGPYYVYVPGLTITGLKSSVKFFNTIRGHNAHKIESGKDWLIASQMKESEGVNPLTRRPVQHPFTMQVIEEHQSYAIPAQATLNALLSDRSLTSIGLTQIQAFDKVNAFEQTFNELIEPEKVDIGDYPRSNPQWKQIVEVPGNGGMLALRIIWAEEALEGLKTGRVLVDIARIIDANPYLLNVWKEAIKNTILPSLNAFKVTANVKLASIEERIRAGKQLEYDPFSTTLMWLLGRQPERTALSRTLESARNTGQGGITLEAVRALIQETQAANKPDPIQQTAMEFVQCPRCGNRCEMVAGGPPQICWRCNFGFHTNVVDLTTFEPPDSNETEISFDKPQVVTPTLSEDEEIANIAAEIQSKSK